MTYNAVEEYYFYYGITIGAAKNRIVKELDTTTLVGHKYFDAIMDGLSIGQEMTPEEFADFVREEAKDWKKEYTTSVLSRYNN